MARRKKASKRSGNWLLLIVGMVLGVAAAVAVALFVTQAPMPFKDKASRSIPTTLLPDIKNAPDPNIALYGKDGPAGTRSNTLGGSGLASADKAPPQANSADGIGQIIAGLEPDKPKVAPATGSGVASATATRPAPEKTTKANTQTTYYLQTGAFRSRDDAQAMMARVLLLGLPVHIEAGQANGATINRVRVGPFNGIDEMNRARTRLGDEKIESAVVRPQP